MDHFVCVLRNGETLDFDGKCTSVNYSSNNLCVFEVGEGFGKKAIALIPYSRIEKIIRYEKL